MASKSVRMPERWPAKAVSVTTVGHFDGSRPQSRAFLFQVEDPRWRGPPLRWNCELDDPMYLRLVEASGCTDSPLVGYPVTVGLERRNGFDHVVELTPAPAGRSKNGLHWVRLQPVTQIDPEELLARLRAASPD